MLDVFIYVRLCAMCDTIIMVMQCLAQVKLLQYTGPY